MPTWTESDARCEVLTFKAGMLSAMGHDLLLAITRFSLTLDDDHVVGTFDGSSLKVLGALNGETLDTDALSERDKRDILTNIQKVFAGHRQSEIRFEAEDLEVSDDFIEGEGELTIPPHFHAVDFEVAIDGDQATCEIVLHQPHWGITPFKALMGALKIKPDVRIRIVVPWKS